MYSSSKKSIELLWQYALLALIFSAGFVGYVLKSTDWFRAIPGDLLDARFNSVILEHLFQWVKGIAPKLWSPAYFYPHENVLAFSDNHFGSGWSYILFRLTNFPREQAFLGWFIVGNVFNFWSSYYIFRRLNFSIAASSFGAFIYAFGLPALSKEAHAQLLYRFAVPLSFFAMYQFLQGKRLVDFVWTIFWLVIQFFCSIYLGVFLTYLLAALTISFFFLDRSSFWKQFRNILTNQSDTMNWISAILLIFLLSLLSALLYQYQTVSSQFGFIRSVAEIQSMLPTVSSYLISDHSTLSGWIGGNIPPFHMRQEHQMFFGIGVWILGLMGCWYVYDDAPNEKLGRLALWSFIILFILTISINAYSIYRLLLYLPGISSVRAVSRVALVMLLPIAILASIAVDKTFQRLKTWSTRCFFLVILIPLVLSESIFYRSYNTQISKWIERQMQLKHLLPATISKNNIIFATGKPGDYQDGVVEVDAMILAQDMHLPTLNGYSGNFPPGHRDPYPCISFQYRLDNYFNLFKDTNLKIDSLTKRVTLLPLYVCPTTPTIITDRAINRETASQIKLSAFGELRSPNLYVTVNIENKANETFSSLSNKGPIRLSWRFVPLNKNGQDQKSPEWTPRKDLYFALQQGQVAVEIIEILLPTKPGLYRFEMTIVQDGVAWFHDLGMSISSQIIEIK